VWVNFPHPPLGKPFFPFLTEVHKPLAFFLEKIGKIPPFWEGGKRRKRVTVCLHQTRTLFFCPPLELVCLSRRKHPGKKGAKGGPPSCAAGEGRAACVLKIQFHSLFCSGDGRRESNTFGVSKTVPFPPQNPCGKK